MLPRHKRRPPFLSRVSDMSGLTTVTNKLATVVRLCLLALAPLAERFSERRISVRGVRPDLWDWLYVESARRRIPLGQLLNVLIADWQARTEAERRAAIDQYQRKEQSHDM